MLVQFRPGAPPQERRAMAGVGLLGGIDSRFHLCFQIPAMPRNIADRRVRSKPTVSLCPSTFFDRTCRCGGNFLHCRSLMVDDLQRIAFRRRKVFSSRLYNNYVPKG
jgi:hypothetical protein